MRERGLGDDFANRLPAVHIEALAAGYFELQRVETKLVKDRGMDVGDVMRIFHSMESEFIGCTMHDPASDSAPREPRAKAVRMVISSISLGTRRTTEFGTPHDEGFVEHTAALEIFQQAGNRFVHLRGQLGMVLNDAGMSVPGSSPSSAMKTLGQTALLVRQAGARQDRAGRRGRVVS